MHHRPTRVAQGFTLLELLLAVAVTAALSAGLFAGMGVVLNTRESAQRVLDGQSSARIALAMVRDQLTSAIPPDGQWADEFVGQSSTNRHGDAADSLVFYCTSLALPTGESRGDQHRIELALAEVTHGPAEGTFQLVQRVVDDLETDAVPDAVVQVLVRGVASLSLRYHDGIDWVEAWDNAERGDELPRAVEVVVELARPEDQADEPDEQLTRFVRIIPLPRSGLQARGF